MKQMGLLRQKRFASERMKNIDEEHDPRKEKKAGGRSNKKNTRRSLKNKRYGSRQGRML